MARPKGIPLTPEHNEKLQTAARNRNWDGHTQETKETLSQAGQEQWAQLPHEEKIVRLERSLRKERTLVCELCTDPFTTRAGRAKYCKGCIPDGSWAQRFKFYGVTKKIWDKMLLEQEGHCALCEKEPTVVDHDHETNVVRGLLCWSCNHAMSGIDVPGWVDRALIYAARGKN